jgi:radical SAM superfamily enzyme YgiQ (UPF0313 family)
MAIPAKYDFETGVYRPPSEGGSHSLLVRLTRNCPWNRCTFCSMYKTEKFQVRPVAEIKQDIDAVAAICNDLRAASLAGGHEGRLTREAVHSFIDSQPGLNYHQGFAMVYYWLLSGAQTAFLQDANSLIMKTDQLVDVLRYLRQTFATIKRVTTYARSRTIVQKPAAELEAIRRAGLDRLHVGLESGDDALLKKINKGVTADGHIRAGKKALAAGFQLSEYWMPGLGGKTLWEDHARHTAQVLNAINPHYIRSRPFFPLPGSELYNEVTAGSFEMLSAREQLIELKQTMEALEVTSKVCFDHTANYWKDADGQLIFSHSYEGYQFPDQKAQVLALIDRGIAADGQRPAFTHL